MKRIAIFAALLGGLCAAASAQQPKRSTVCIYEGGLLAKAVQMRDLGVSLPEAQSALAEDLRRESSYSPEFRSALSDRLERIYDDPALSADDVRMAYLKWCDPKHFNWY